VDSLVRRALEKDPDRRFASAKEMAAAIDACAAARRDLAPERAIAAARPRRLDRRIVVALGAALLVVAAAWLAWPTGDDGDDVDADAAAAMQLTEIRVDVDRASREDDPAARRKALEDLHAKLSAIAAAEPDEWTFALMADVHRRLGCYGLAANETTRVVEKDPSDLGARARLVLDRLAAAPERLAFLAVGLFPHVDADDVRATEEMLASAGATQADVALVASVARWADGGSARGEENAKIALASGAARSDVLAVRATFELLQLAVDPGSPTSRSALEALLHDVTDELRADPRNAALRWLRSFGRHLAGDSTAAWEDADGLLSLAPTSAETYLLRCVLHERENRWDLAQENFDKVARLDPAVDFELARLYLGVISLVGTAGKEAPILETLDDLRSRLDHRLARWNEPASLFLRATVEEIGSQWDGAAADLTLFQQSVDPRSLALDRFELTQVAALSTSPTRTRLMCVSRDLQLRMTLPILCRRTCEALLDRLSNPALAAADGLAPDERVSVERDTHWALAALAAAAGDDAGACDHLEEALRRGAKLNDVQGDSRFATLRDRPAFRALLERHER
jgi:hypothetical protein